MYEHVVIFLGLIVPPRFSGDSLERLVNLPGGAPNHADTPPRLLPRSQVMTVACNLRVVTRGWAGLSPVQWRCLGRRRRRASGRPRSHTVSWMALCDALAPSPPWNDGFCFFWFSYFVKIISFFIFPRRWRAGWALSCPASIFECTFLLPAALPSPFSGRGSC